MSSKSPSLKEIGSDPARGFRDIMPEEAELRDRLIAIILETYRSFGFDRIESPIVEDIRRLKQSEGGENLAMLFEILKRGEKLDLASASSKEDLVDLGLRYDLTVPLARFFSNNRGQLLFPFKAIQIGPVFRAERPQKGRYRQFYQCDIDMMGVPAPTAEIELIIATMTAIKNLGFDEAVVRLNDRRLLLGMTHAAGISEDRSGLALIILDKMDKVGLDGVRDLMLKDGFGESAVDKLIGIARKLSEAPTEQRIKIAAQLISAPGVDAACADTETIVRAVSEVFSGKIKIEFDPFLVRGMGYYTGAVFEISIPGSAGSAAGGGRYDKLIGKLSGTDVPACGFSIGFERIVAILLEKGALPGTSWKRLGLFVDPSQAALSEAAKVQQDLRSQGYAVSLLPEPKNFKEALSKLENAGFHGFVRLKPGEKVEVRSFQK